MELVSGAEKDKFRISGVVYRRFLADWRVVENGDRGTAEFPWLEKKKREQGLASAKHAPRCGLILDSGRELCASDFCFWIFYTGGGETEGRRENEHKGDENEAFQSFTVTLPAGRRTNKSKK